MGEIQRNFLKKSVVKCTKPPIDSISRRRRSFETKYEHLRRKRKGSANLQKHDPEYTRECSTCASYNLQDRRAGTVFCRRVVRRRHTRSSRVGAREGSVTHRSRGG